jgi:hypothetical protein
MVHRRSAPNVSDGGSTARESLYSSRSLAHFEATGQNAIQVSLVMYAIPNGRGKPPFIC